jgi:hypothetical protein
MSFQWSISTDRRFRRCQRQFFFQEIAANHSSKDWRREAFIPRQMKTLELWRGTLIHEGIQYYVYETEWLGFNDAIKRLVDEGLLPRDILVGAVAAPKHRSYGVRLALATSSGLENPTLGSWEMFSKTEGIVCTTGWPFNIPGTVEPLVVLLARGGRRRTAAYGS